VAAISPHLAPGMSSVGTSASLEHRRASPVGAKLVVEAELTEVDGRRLVFSFVARESGQRPRAPGDSDEDRVVGAGTVERVLVDREAFLSRVAAEHRP
jgi:fluoroacetyl-CoA thioesterase